MKNKIIAVVFLISLCLISFNSITYTSGPPESYTNAPGEGNCANPGCHGGSAITSGVLHDSINLTVVGGSLSNLLYDSTYSFQLTFSNPSSVKYGFQLCVLESGANNTFASLGTLISSSTQTQIISSSNRDYLEHTSSGTSASGNTKTWNFQWHTPNSYFGGATFYVVINSSDNNSSSSGDTILVKTFSTNITLPVTWMDVSAKRLNQQEAILKWKTASELNNKSFTIEKSDDGSSWVEIATLSGANNTNSISSYTYIDKNAVLDSYYRIKQTDYDGKFSYSSIVFVMAPLTQSILYYDYINHNLTSVKNIINSVSIMYPNGVIMPAENVHSLLYNLPPLPHGLYYLIVKIGNEQIIKKIIY